MKPYMCFLGISTLILASLVDAPRVLGQEETSKPKPAARRYPPLLESTDGQEISGDPTPSSTSLRPDARPLTGVQVPTLGSPEIRHSYWIPGFQCNDLVQSTALNQTTVAGWNSVAYVAGDLSLMETWNRSQLAVNYSGGGSFSTIKSQGNSNYQQLGLVESLDWRRWQVTVIDQFSYLSQSQFGFGTSTNLATPGVGGPLGPTLPSLQTSYQPTQSIFTSIGPSLSNSITSQVAYAVSRRGSVTFSGSYGILRFVDPGSIDTNDTIFSGGYSYALSPRDTIGLLYRFSAYRYIGDPHAINDHVSLLAYGRKITGTLALQLFGGPEVTNLQVPLNGSSNQISGSGGANLTYGRSRGSLSLAYNHGVTGGSGQFTGSTADQLQTAIAYQLSRVWRANLPLGFARNTSLRALSPSQVSQTFDSWFIGGGLSRPLGRTANFTFAYTAYIQHSELPVCAGGTCATDHLQHQISVGFQWHTRPLVLR